MRVIVLADFAVPTGGAQKVAMDSAMALARADIPVTYVHAIGTQADPALAEAGVTTIGLGFPDVWDRSAVSGALTGIWHRQAARALQQTLAERLTGDTILHLHQYTRAFSPAILPVLADSGRPVALTLHDYFTVCPNGLYYRFDRHEPCALTPLSASCLIAACDPKSPTHKAIRVLRALATRRVLAMDRLYLVHVSDRTLDLVRAFLPAQARHHRIDNPVAVEPCPPAPIRPEARIAYLGRMTREKGADLAAIAAARTGVPILFVGDGPMAETIRVQAPQADLAGWRSSSEVGALLRGGMIRAVMAPSLWPETGPLTVYEAQAAGVPVIVSDRAGAAAAVRHGETGFVVPPTEEALAAAMLRLGDPATVTAMGRAAHAHYWAEPPTPEAHARRLLELYTTMLTENADPAQGLGMQN